MDFAGGGFHRLIEAPPRAGTKPFPRKLSETGLFDSTRDVRPAPGLIPYSVNAPLWSDGARKERYLALPGNSQIEFDVVIYPHGPNYADRGWRFPDGTILVKTFSLDMEKGNPASSKRLETRILQHRKMPGNDDEYGARFWFGYTYLWNDEQTDADLLPAEGLSRSYTIRDPAAPGGTREQTWKFPSRTECTLCHTMASKYILGVTTLQMNKDHDYGESKENQLTVLERLGVFKERLPQPPERLPRLVDYQDVRADLNLPLARLPARQLRPLSSQVGRRQRRFRSASLDPARRNEGREHASRPGNFRVGRPAHPGSRRPGTLPRLSTNEDGRPRAHAARRLLGGGPGGTHHAACLDPRALAMGTRSSDVAPSIRASPRGTEWRFVIPGRARASSDWLLRLARRESRPGAGEKLMLTALSVHAVFMARPSFPLAPRQRGEGARRAGEGSSTGGATNRTMVVHSISLAPRQRGEGARRAGEGSSTGGATNRTMVVHSISLAPRQRGEGARRAGEGSSTGGATNRTMVVHSISLAPRQRGEGARRAGEGSSTGGATNRTMVVHSSPSPRGSGERVPEGRVRGLLPGATITRCRQCRFRRVKPNFSPAPALPSWIERRHPVTTCTPT